MAKMTGVRVMGPQGGAAPRRATVRRSLLALGPAQGDRMSAWRVGLSVAVPSLGLLALGRPGLIIYAVFGAFIGMYGRNEPHQMRLVHQAQAAVLLVGGTLIGIGLSALGVRPWTLVLTEAFIAGVGSLFADRYRLKPAGPFFCLFALGACASVPLAVPWWGAAIACVGSAGFAAMVGFAGWFGAQTWASGAGRPVVPTVSAAVLVHALRYVLAVGTAGAAGILMGIGHPYWAMAAGAVPLAAETLGARVQRGIHRVFGTLAGVGLTALVLLPRPSVMVLGLLVVALQFPSELFMARHYGFALVFFTPLVLVMTYLAAPTDPGILMADRAVETAIGAAAGVLVAVFIREPGTSRNPLR
ncbi:FUSC family protein [Paeniglutamicibacter quisquiliarum]|uniref:FUSC family protein n=1 Tax=Paeniglutamicibacter quisquiliarum TaxID=2849498 RepID=UPI0020C27424|nr:FUSC family protein [Paeniglutamicibacter quisquiliarum]